MEKGFINGLMANIMMDFLYKVWNMAMEDSILKTEMHTKESINIIRKMGRVFIDGNKAQFIKGSLRTTKSISIGI